MVLSHFLAARAAALLPLLAAASLDAAATPDPLDPKAAVPTLSYASSLAAYKRFADAKAVSWREANELVTRIGGWRTYAREASQPDAPPVPPPAAPTAAPAAKPAAARPTPAGHSGHAKP